jgi:Virulence-associated protein E
MARKKKSTPQPAKAKAVLIPGIRWPEETEREGKPKKGSMMNVLRAIDLMGLETKLDLFTGRYTVEGSEMQKFVGDVTDKVARKFRAVCFRRFRYEPGREATMEGLQRACEDHMYNSLADYLEECAGKWDGKARRDQWLTTYLGVEDTPLHRAWGRIVLSALCRRAFDPGCKFDHVLVLEGPEGANKSTALKVLACGRDAEARPDYFSDSTILDKDERAQMELTKGVWIYELSEMAGSTKADQKKLKAFITRQEERARPAYGYFKENQPRIAVFIGTINTDANTGETVEYLNPGDRRRWWPVRVGLINIPALIRDRDQLFAETMVKDRIPGDPALLLDARDPDMWKLQFGERSITDALGSWKSLKLDPALFDAAKVEQVEREISDTMADRLSTLYDELTAASAMARVVLNDGRELKPDVDYAVTETEVFVASKTVVEMLPASLTSDGRRMAAAMGKHGWSRTRRGRAKVSGYVHPRQEPWH